MGRRTKTFFDRLDEFTTLGEMALVLLVFVLGGSAVAGSLWHWLSTTHFVLAVMVAGVGFLAGGILITLVYLLKRMGLLGPLIRTFFHD